MSEKQHKCVRAASSNCGIWADRIYCITTDECLAPEDCSRCTGREAHLPRYNVCIKPSKATCPFDYPNKVFCETDFLCKTSCEQCPGMPDIDPATNASCLVRKTKEKFKIKVKLEVSGYTVDTFGPGPRDAYRESLAFVFQTSKRHIIILKVEEQQRRRLLQFSEKNKTDSAKQGRHLFLGSAINVITDIQQLSGNTADEVVERAFDVLKSTTLQKVMKKTYAVGSPLPSQRGVN